MRFFHRTGATLTDRSEGIARYLTGSESITYTDGDYLYLGQELAFNHFFIKLGTLNARPATMVAEYWDGDQWRTTSELRDNTEGLTASEFVEFTPNRDYRWCRDNTNYGGDTVTGLTDVVIYDMYWIRISFDVTLDAITVSWIGNKFSDDLDLHEEHPRLNNSTLKTLFETGKTTWEAQHVKAAEIIVRDLKDQGIILSAGQILRRQDYKLASIAQAAKLIYQGLGDDFKDDVIEMHKEYKQRLKLKVHGIDLNADGELDMSEKFQSQGWLSR